MKVLENIASDLEQRIADASIGNSSRPTIDQNVETLILKWNAY